MNILDFTNDEVQSAEFPPGDYVMECVMAELKNNASNNGQYVRVKLRVTGGPQKGRSVYHVFNVKHPSEQAQKIGRSEMKTMMLAMGMGPVLESVTDLVGRSCLVKIGLSKDKNGNLRPAVKGFHLDKKKEETKPTTSF